MTKSVSEDVRTSGVTMNIYDMDRNVIMGEGVKPREDQGTSSVKTTSFSHTLALASTIETSLIDTSTSLPPFTHFLKYNESTNYITFFFPIH